MLGPIARKVLQDAKRAMEERKRLAGGHDRPAEIQDFPWSPGKNAEERSHKGSGRLDAPPQRPAATSGEEDDGVRMGGGRADFSGGSFSFRNKDTARPTLDEALVCRSRRYPDAPEDS